MSMGTHLKSGAIILVFVAGMVSIAMGRTIYVDDDGPADFNTIQAAIDDSNDGDTIIVADGIYTGEGNRDIEFLGKAITLCSENGPKNCIIDCNGTESEPHRGFYFHSGEKANSIINGFTITNGYGEEEQMPWGDPFPIPAGGAFFCADSSPSIINCIIKGNSAAYGGAFFCHGSSLILTNCMISSNFADLRGGGVFNYQSDPVMSRCVFASNYGGAAGGGVCNLGCSPTFSNCRFVGNIAPVVLLTGGGGGGVNNNGGSPLLTNCIFSGNSAGCGGAVSNEGSTPKFINCTFNDNLGYGDAMCNWGDTCNPTVKNCILWNGSSEIEIVNKLDATIDITYSDVRAGWLGLGNIDVDPCLIEPGYWEDPCNTPTMPWDDIWVDGDYHLKSQAGRWNESKGRWTKDDVTSPCIDAGDPMSPIGLETFPNGGRINMGAFGGTEETSKSYFGKPVCEIIVAGDVNGDCIVNFKDFALMSLHWLRDENQ
jgi:hypothetical protein